MLQGKHPAIISVATYNKIQERLGLKANNQFTRKSDNDDFPIRGFALCPECKEPYTGSWSTGRNKKYPYYRCCTKECNLPKKSIKRDTLEACFESTLKVSFSTLIGPLCHHGNGTTPSAVNGTT